MNVLPPQQMRTSEHGTDVSHALNTLLEYQTERPTQQYPDTWLCYHATNEMTHNYAAGTN